MYTIGSNGAITIANGGAPVATGVSPSVLRVDSTGKWLLGASAFAGQAYVYEIGSGGSLTAISSSVVTLNASTPATDLEIAPGGNYVFVSCGTAGIYEMSFSTGSGALAQINGVLNPKNNGGADMGLAVSPSGNYLFAAETVTGGVRVFSIGTNGVLTEVSGSPYPTNSGRVVGSGRLHRQLRLRGQPHVGHGERLSADQHRCADRGVGLAVRPPGHCRSPWWRTRRTPTSLRSARAGTRTCRCSASAAPPQGR